MTAYDLERLTPGGVKVSHHEGKIVTDGPWLVLYAAGEGPDMDLIVPAHAVVGLEPCKGGRCRGGGE